VVLKVPRVAHVFLRQTQQEQASSSYVVATGFQKKKHNTEIFRLLLKILICLLTLQKVTLLKEKLEILWLFM